MRFRKISREEVKNAINFPLLIEKEGDKYFFWGISEKEGFIKVISVREENKMIILSAVRKKSLPKRVKDEDRV